MAVAFIDFYLVASDGRVIQLLPQHTYVFGRDEEADISIQDTLTSRRHCELRWDDGSFWTLVDLESRNGTYCNGHRLADPHPLSDHDLLQVGGQQFTYRLLPPGSDAQAIFGDNDTNIGRLETFEVSRNDILGEDDKPAFVGEVPDGDLKKLLRFFSLTKKSGRLDLDSPPERKIWLVEGVPRRTLYGDQHGMDALAKLVGDPGKTFSFLEGERIATADWSITGDRLHLMRDVLGSTDISDLGIDAEDLAKAERLQRHLMARIPEIPGYELGVYYEGLSGVSGDFYDVGVMPNGNVVIVLGDVAGHGVQAAMAVAGMVKSLRTLRKENRPLEELLVALNDDLRQDLLPGQFITIFAAMLTPYTGELTIALAGHHQGLHLNYADGVKIENLGNTGPAMGIFDSKRFRDMISLAEIRLNIGEGLMQYTDGILEAMNSDHEEFGEERLQEAVVAIGSDTTAQDLVNKVVSKTKSFASSIEDDLTLLSLIRRGPSPPPVESPVMAGATGATADSSLQDTNLASQSALPPKKSAVNLPPPKPNPQVTPAHGSIKQKSDPWLGVQFGQVETVCRISQGSMGMVYRGHHQLLNTDVAVKIMSSRDEAKTELNRKRFLREAQAAARVRHANVVQVIDVGNTSDNGIYLIMELIEGPNLSRRLDDHGKMSDQELLPIAKGIAEGLAAIHQHGIIHRDIKPDNILIDPMGVAKISDLGLARLVDSSDTHGLTATGMVLGTPTYISPEAIRDSTTADAKSDIYSLGVTLYHLLAGRAPFDGRTIGDLMRAHLKGEHIPLQSLAPTANPTLCKIIESCISLEPAQRPTANQLAMMLGDAEQRRNAGPVYSASQGNAVPEFFRKKQRTAQTPLLARTGFWIGVSVTLVLAMIIVVLVMNRHWFI